MKKLMLLLVLCSGCAMTTTRVSPTPEFPGYTMRTFVFGNAEMAESAQSFAGNLTVMSPTKTVIVDMSNGQNSKGLNANGLESVVSSIVSGVLRAVAIP